jgi:hypothetical protein
LSAGATSGGDLAVAAENLQSQSAPIHTAIEIRNVLMQTSETTSCTKSVMIPSCFQYVRSLFSFHSNVKHLRTPKSARVNEG